MRATRTKLAPITPLHRRLRPDAPASPSRLARAPLGLLGMLVFVATVETSLARRWETLCEPVAFSWRYSLDRAEHTSGQDILILGDSLAKHGLIPPVIQAQTQQPATNLAAAAAPAPMTYFALRRALDAGARPRALILEYKPSVLAGGPKFRTRHWPEALRVSEWSDLLLTSTSMALAAEVLVGVTLPSFRMRHDVRKAVLDVLRGEPPRTRDLNAICRRNWDVNGGGNLAADRREFNGSVPESTHRELRSDAFAAHKVNARYMERTLRLAERHRIPTYLLLPPFAPELHARRTASGAEAKFTAFIEALTRRHPGLTVLDARGSGYPHTAFVDASHLDREGAVVLSLDVAEALARDRDGRGSDRWQTLPTFRPRPDPVALEDVEQSRERLGIAWHP